jgi:hypothetical protein
MSNKIKLKKQLQYFLIINLNKNNIYSSELFEEYHLSEMQKDNKHNKPTRSNSEDSLNNDNFFSSSSLLKTLSKICDNKKKYSVDESDLCEIEEPIIFLEGAAFSYMLDIIYRGNRQTIIAILNKIYKNSITTETLSKDKIQYSNRLLNIICASCFNEETRSIFINKIQESVLKKEIFDKNTCLLANIKYCLRVLKTFEEKNQILKLIQEESINIAEERNKEIIKEIIDFYILNNNILKQKLLNKVYNHEQESRFNSKEI